VRDRGAGDEMFDYARAAVEAALAAGASYADARVVIRRHERLNAHNGELESVTNAEDAGVGVRALVGSSWGFAATGELTDTAAKRAGGEATATAKASALVPGAAIELADVPVAQDTYETPHAEDPFAVPLAEKVELIVGATRTMHEVEGIAVATAHLGFWDTDKWFVSSQGHRIHQHLVESGGGMDATAVGEHETQRRSYPQSFGHYETGGYEVIRRFDLAGNAQPVAEEAVQLLSAAGVPHRRDGPRARVEPARPADPRVGRPRDRARPHPRLGGRLRRHQLPRPRPAREPEVRLGADEHHRRRHHPRRARHLRLRRRGHPAQRVDIVKEGTWVGALTGRDTAHLAGLEPGGMVRADGFNRLPMVRMTNVGLLPGDSSLEEIISETKRGVYLATNRSWSIDDKRLNFQFGTEIGWEIVDGKLGRMVKNPTYTGITPQFWASLDMLAGEDEWVPWGVPNCGKGQPMQVGHTGHPASPGRFKDVRVGVKG
jgi:TldD protein